MELVTRNYWWLRVMRNIEKYVDRYNIYQRIKNYIEVLIRKLMVNEVLKKLWIHLTVNFITKLLLVVEKDAILVICFRLFKIAHFVEEILVEGLVRLFIDNVWKLYRLPKSVISDKRP